MGIITEMNLLLQANIPQWIAKLQRLGPRGRERIEWAAAKAVPKNLRIHGPRRPPLGEPSASQRRWKAQDFVLRVDRVKGAPKESTSGDPRVQQLGRTFSDEFAVIREKYRILHKPPCTIAC